MLARLTTYLAITVIFFSLRIGSPSPISGTSGWIFWSLNERYSAVIAFAIILIYLALYALFLQPFLGDAARYFRASPGNVTVRREIRRQAVNTLETLHKWGTYDRIVIVAHSLGTVVAYDMLRAYFSRICNDLPECGTAWSRSSRRSTRTIWTIPPARSWAKMIFALPDARSSERSPRKRSIAGFPQIKSGNPGW